MNYSSFGRSWIFSSTCFTSRGIPADYWNCWGHPVKFLHILFKTFKRIVFRWLLGQEQLERHLITDNDYRILWINISAPSIGDSLMDLASRQLLANTQRVVDLFTHPKNSTLYEKDHVFNCVYVDASKASVAHAQLPYDLIILDSFGTTAIKLKKQIAPCTPYVGLWGFINGYEIHRIHFGFERMGDLLKFSTKQTTVAPRIPSLNNTLFSSPNEVQKVCQRIGIEKIPPNSVAVVVGAEWNYRRYSHWPDVVKEVLEHRSVVLFGATNGMAEAQAILEAIQHSPRCINFVGQLSLREAVSVMSQCQVAICADGGLWHVACAMKIPNIVMFADTKLYDSSGCQCTRATSDMITEPLYDPVEVSRIPVAQVIKAFEQLNAQLYRKSELST